MQIANWSRGNCSGRKNEQVICFVVKGNVEGMGLVAKRVEERWTVEVSQVWEAQG